MTQENFPHTIQVGDVKELNASHLPKIDLLIGGSPCHGFSRSVKGLNFKDPRSELFFEFVRPKEELNPEFFLLENVKMKTEYQKVISDNLGVEPVLINSSLVSAQNRERLYWTNLPIPKIQDKKIYLRDVLDNDSKDYSFIPEEKIFNKKFTSNGLYYGGLKKTGDYPQSRRAWLPDGKHGCLTAGRVSKVYVNGRVRKTTQI